MPVEDHPKYPAWNKALDHMMTAERRHFDAIVLKKTDSEKRMAFEDMHKAREAYHLIADNLD